VLPTNSENNEQKAGTPTGGESMARQAAIEEAR
jgi:hypothetical protein